MYIKEIESCFNRFIWNGKPDKIKRLTLIGDYEKGGGVNMVDINSYFKSLNFIYLFPQIFWFLISLKLVGVFVCPPPNSTQQFIISL
jgi:hypothetical protein